MENKLIKFLIKLLGLWNIYGGILMATLVAWLVDFSKGMMDNITSFLIMNLAFMSTLTFLKWSIFDKKPKTIVEKTLMSQSSIRAMKSAINPNEMGEEIGQAIIETTNIIERVEKKMFKKIKEVFNWIKTYWQQIVGITGALVEVLIIAYFYIEDKFAPLLKFFPEGKNWEIGVKVGIGVLTVLFVFYQIRNQVKWVGVGSLEKAEEYLKSLSNKVQTNMSAKTKANVKNALKTLKSNLKQLSKKYDSLEHSLKEVNNEITSELELLNLGVGDNNKYAELTSKKREIEVELSTIEGSIHNSEKSIAKYSEILAVKK